MLPNSSVTSKRECASDKGNSINASASESNKPEYILQPCATTSFVALHHSAFCIPALHYVLRPCTTSHIALRHSIFCALRHNIFCSPAPQCILNPCASLCFAALHHISYSPAPQYTLHPCSTVYFAPCAARFFFNPSGIITPTC